MRWLAIISISLLSIGSAHAFIFGPSKYQEQINQPIFPEKSQPKIQNTFIFDPNHLQWAVYNKQGERVGFGKAIGGKSFCADTHEPCKTVEGTYTVFRKKDEDCTSKTFPIDEGGGAPMPHCMFFYKGYAIHGSNQLPDKNTSHGCIRVTKAAAKWMNKYYIEPGSTVVVIPYQDKQIA